MPAQASRAHVEKAAPDCGIEHAGRLVQSCWKSSSVPGNLTWFWKSCNLWKKLLLFGTVDINIEDHLLNHIFAFTATTFGRFVMPPKPGMMDSTKLF